MEKMVFVNLPVADLAASVKFFVAMGFTVNPKFTDESAACIVTSDTIYAMLLTHGKFSEFTRKKIVDASAATEVLVSLALESKDEVNAVMARVLGSGGSEFRQPYDYGFMYGRAFEDPDGHVWELFWMDPARAQ